MSEEVAAGPMLLGAMYWPTAQSEAEVDRDLAQMRDHGLGLIRIFLPWLTDDDAGRGDRDDLEGSPLWVDWVYRQAERHGIRVAPTFHAWSDPAKARPEPYCLDNPELLAGLRQHLEAVVRRYHNSPAQGAWILRNEPGYRENCRCEHTLARYRRWLAATYGQVAALNAAYRTGFPSFEAVEPPAQQSTWIDYARVMDWHEFGCWNLADQLRWMGGVVKEIDPDHPTHANPHGLLSNGLPRGQSLWDEGRALDVLGNSIHPCHHFRALRREDGDDFRLGHSIVCDLTRSASREKRHFWVTELQGGPSFTAGAFPYCPSPAEIQTFLWQGLGAGAEATVYWLWNSRPWDWEAGEFALVLPDGTPSRRLAETRRFAEALARHRGFFAGARPVSGRTAIYCSRRNWALAAREHSQWVTRDDPVHAAIACYRALWNRGLVPDFLDRAELLADGAEGYGVLYLPELRLLDEAEARALRQFVQAGGALWADGLFAFRHDTGQLHASRPPYGLDEVFGARIGEVEGRAALGFGPAERRYDGTFVQQEIRPTTAEVVLRFDEGQPAVTRNRFGAGLAYLVGTSACLAQFRTNRPGNLGLVQLALREADLPPLRVEGERYPVGVRLLSNGSRLGAILANHGPAQEVVLRLPGTPSEVTTVEGREPTEAETGDRLRVRLDAGVCAAYIVSYP